MHLFSPDRPLLYGEVPAYCDDFGHPLAPTGRFSITMLPHGRFEVGNFWRTQGFSASWFAVEVDGPVALVKLLRRYEADPEQAMKEVWGWGYNEGKMPAVEPELKGAERSAGPSQAAVGLGDLGL